jgi:hypothetical protein
MPGIGYNGSKPLAYKEVLIITGVALLCALYLRFG